MDGDIRTDVGGAVRSARAAVGWTQEHLAAAAGLSAKTVKRLEGGREVAVDSLRDVCAALGLDFSSTRSLGGGGRPSGVAPIPEQPQIRAKRPYFILDEGGGDGILAVGGGQASVIRLGGADHLPSPARLAKLVSGLETELGVKLCRSGHAVQIWFANTPGKALPPVSGAPEGAVSDILAERAALAAAAHSWCDVRLVLWTSATAAGEAKARWPMEGGATPVRPSCAVHKSFVSNVLATLHVAGMQARQLGTAEAMAEAECLPGGMPDAEETDGVVRAGDGWMAALDMVAGPQDLAPFAALVDRMGGASAPLWRASFLLDGGAMADGGPGVTVRTRICFATWASGRDEAEAHRSALHQAVESWGMGVALPADAQAGAGSSALLRGIGSSAPAALAPLSEVLRMAPWYEASEAPGLPTSPPGTCDLVVGPPGTAKSTLLAARIVDAIAASPARLPLIGAIDVFPAIGLAAIVSEALPEAQKGDVAIHRLRLDDRTQAVNLCDTRLGCRHLLRQERAQLANFLTVLAGDPRRAPAAGLGDLVNMVIVELYEKFSDRSKRGMPRLYIEGEESRIDTALRHLMSPDERERLNRLGDDITWWSIVDAFAARGEHALAALAQSHAVPRLEDFLVIRTPALMDAFGSVHTETGMPLVDYFTTGVSAALRAWPALTGPTRINMTDARLRVVDIGLPVGGSGPSDDRYAAVAWMVARRLVGEGMFDGEDDIAGIPEDYRDWHRKAIRATRATPRMLVIDELHRVTSFPTVVAQIATDRREGRKWGVGLSIGTQLCPPGVIGDDAELVLVTGLGGDRHAREIAATLNLNPASLLAVRDQIGPRPGAIHVYSHARTRQGVKEGLRTLLIGPRELWTHAADTEARAVADHLAALLGPTEAVRSLATRFPGGPDTLGRTLETKRQPADLAAEIALK